MDIQQLLDSVKLVDIRLIERDARLKLDPSPDHGLATLPEDSPAGETSIDVNPVSWGTHIETWFRMRFVNELSEIACSVAVIYEREGDEEIGQDLRYEFIERVSVMAAYPYLRAEIQHQMADLRLGSLTLGLLKQGEFKIDREQPANKGEDA